MRQCKSLLVEDDATFAANLKLRLEIAGYAVALARDGVEGLRQVQTFAPDVILLDYNLPRKNGVEVLRTLREGGNWTPIIMLTEVLPPDVAPALFHLGVDYFLHNKTSRTDELLAIIEHIRRRPKPSIENSLRNARYLVCGDLILDSWSRQVWKAGKQINLTPKAVCLLEFLMRHYERPFSEDKLLDVCWAERANDVNDGVRDARVTQRIAEIRKALVDAASNPCYIETVYPDGGASGYRFMQPVTGAETVDWR